MGLRHAAVMAGLALGLMSGAAEAAAITYSVDYTVTDTGRPSVHVAGTFTTDGTIGTLSYGDILDYDLEVNSVEATSSNSSAFVDNNSLIANKNGTLTYSFMTATGDFGIQDPSGPDYLGFSKGGGFYYARYSTAYPYYSYENAIPETNFVFGISSVSSVPLPASAPMFGAALMALGTVGYGLKRKKAAAQV